MTHALEDLWAQAGDRQRQAKPSPDPAPISDDARIRQTVGAIAAGWPGPSENGATPNRHEGYLLPLFGYLAGVMPAGQAASIVAQAARQSGDRDFIHGQRDDELDRLARDSASKLGTDAAVRGLPTLASAYPALAAVLRVLWVPEDVDLDDLLGGLADDPVATAEVPRGPVGLTGDVLLTDDEEAIPWLIGSPVDGNHGLLAEQESAMLDGESGLGKSWMASELVAALVTGSAFLNYFPVARPCRVMLIDEESTLRLLRRRVRKIVLGRGLSIPETRALLKENLFLYSEQGISFDDEAKLTAVVRRGLEFRPDVVVGDSLSRLHRRSESDNSEMAALWSGRVKPFMRALQCALVVLHHPRKRSRDAPSDAMSRVRGASDITAQLDELWFLDGKSGDPEALFRHAKCRPAEPVQDFYAVRADTVDGGVTVTRLDPDSLEGIFTQSDTQLRKAQLAMKTALAAAIKLTRDGLLDAAIRVKVSPRYASDALKALIESGEVVRLEEKFKRKHLYAIAKEADE